MRHPDSIRRSAALLATILLASTSVQAQGNRTPRDGDDPTIIRETIVGIDPATLRAWAGAAPGDELALPWFDGKQLDAIADCGRPAGAVTNVFADVDNGTKGSVILTIGTDALVRSANLDGRTYRYQRLAGDLYTLAEIDAAQLMPDNLDSDQPDARPFPRNNRNGPVTRPLATLLPERRLVRRLNRQADRAPGFSARIDDGSQIDVLVGYSQEASDWVGGQEQMEQLEIPALVAKANSGFENSGINLRLRLVGMRMVKHLVLDPSELEQDADLLRAGGGDLGQLHTLRDQLRADLVSLLVFNGGNSAGDDGCGGDTKRACGYGFTQRDLAGPNDQPGTAAWEQDFASLGFSVAHIKAAVLGYTFHHELGHNLGAHHDFYAFWKNNTTPTAERFARGWIVWGQKIRTLMAYNDLCKLGGTSCSIFNRFSNPNDFAGAGEWWGSPVPGGIDGLFGPEGLLGPADNARAINNMAWAVSNYRNSYGP